MRHNPGCGSWLAVALLCGCASDGWYMEVSPFYGTMDLGQRDIDAVQQGVAFTIGHNFGQKAHHQRMENLAVAHLANDRGNLSDLELHHLLDPQDETTSAESELDLSDFTDKPETLDDAAILLVWAGAICLLLITLKQIGILDRFLPNKKDSRQEEE